MSKRILIENYFRNKYPDERYQFKAYRTIEDMFGVKGNNLYVIEFIDKKMKYPKTLELMVSYSELSSTQLTNNTKGG